MKRHNLKPVPLQQVTIKDGFWAERQRVNRQRSIPAIQRQLELTGRLAAWAGDRRDDFTGQRPLHDMFWDSDNAKWLEAAAYSLATHADPQLEAEIDRLIDQLETQQQDDGYLNSYFPLLYPQGKWTNLRDWHELYNAGHLMEAAVAYKQATGKDKLLRMLCRYADHIDDTFGVEAGKARGYPGHPELELALIKLYRETGVDRYLQLAKYMVDERGRHPHYFDQEAADRGEAPEDFWAQTYGYCQAHAPVREHSEATGHAVRACYLYAGIADLALETDDGELLALSRRLWDDLTRHQMYVTGGLGPSHTNEGFTMAYDMPTETAYAETCASIALAFWAQRMFHIDPDSRYIDVMERAIYNGSLSGLSHDGEGFFYGNPMAAYPGVNPLGRWNPAGDDGHYQRSEWFACPCCPPNIARLIASLGEYSYSQDERRVYVHLYHDNAVALCIDGASLRLRQTTSYPWHGDINITLSAAQPVDCQLALRIPDWCRDYSLKLNGEPVTVQLERGYALLSRRWQDGDVIELALAMPVERVMPHPAIRQLAGQVALQRGPLIYCLEEVDNGARLANLCIPDAAQLEAAFDPSLFGGITVIEGEALRIERGEQPADLYRFYSQADYARQPTPFKALPYYLWANRQLGEMRVWMRTC